MEPASDCLSSARALSLTGATLLLVCLLALTACVTKTFDMPKDGPIDAERVVINAKGGDVPVRDVESPERRVAAETALARAEGAWQSGDALTTLALCNQALRDGVPSDLATRFHGLRAKARGAVVASRVLRLRAFPEKDAVATGQDISVKIRVENLSGAEISIPRREGGSSDATFVLKIVRDDYDVYGSRRASEFNIRAPLDHDLTLRPGGVEEAHVMISADLLEVTHEGFAVLRVSGILRPIAVRVGESEFFDAMPVEEAIVRVFLPGWEPLAADPLSSLRKSIAKRAPAHILTSAELLAPTERDQARTILKNTLVNDPQLSFVCEAALARLDQLTGGTRPSVSDGGKAPR